MTAKKTQNSDAVMNAKPVEEIAAAEQNREKKNSRKRKKNYRKNNEGKIRAKNLSVVDGKLTTVVAPGSIQEVRSAKKGRGPKKPLDFATLADVTFVNETPVVQPNPFVITCNICGSTKNVGYFKSANICLKCLNKIKKTM